MPRRPYRATIYLPGHDETGKAPVVRKITAATQGGLSDAISQYIDDGYRVRSYEVLTLPLDIEEGDHGGQV